MHCIKRTCEYNQLLASVISAHLFDFQFPGKKKKKFKRYTVEMLLHCVHIWSFVFIDLTIKQSVRFYIRLISVFRALV
jgi:hypothetical protein